LVSVGVYCLPDVDHVQIDVYRAATEAFEHLLTTGRRRIAYVIDEPTRQGTAEPMLRAYRDFMVRMGQEPRFIIPAKRFPEDIYAAVRADFQAATSSERPDALFCHGDIVAHVALRVLDELKISVPQEVAVVGCGGGDETAFQSPSLTTIQFPVSQMSQVGWQLLQRRINQPDAPIERVMLRAELVIRESSTDSSISRLVSSECRTRAGPTEFLNTVV
jgi:DNA-binding LacI/PurR family transcriptional regulator